MNTHVSIITIIVIIIHADLYSAIHFVYNLSFVPDK